MIKMIERIYNKLTPPFIIDGARLMERFLSNKVPSAPLFDEEEDEEEEEETNGLGGLYEEEEEEEAESPPLLLRLILRRSGLGRGCKKSALSFALDILRGCKKSEFVSFERDMLRSRGSTFTFMS